MTYFITAPLLYKEAVIGGMESLFYGFDDPTPDQQSSFDGPSTQARTSQSVSKNGQSFDCITRPNESHGENDQIANIGLDNPSIDIIHKRALLKLVTAVHIVHNPGDGSMYRDTQSMQVDDLDNIFDDLVEKVDITRYTNIPKSVKDSTSAQVLPNIQRATVGLWCRDGQDDSKPFCPSPKYSTDDFYDYHCHLVSKMYQFSPGTVCRTPWDCSFLNLYPVTWGDIKTNILHEADFCYDGSQLVPGARNYVHVDIGASSYGFSHSIVNTYKYMVTAMASWASKPNLSETERQGTEVIFVVHHPYKREYDKGEESMRRWYKSLKDHEAEARTYMTNHDPYAAEREAH